MPPRELFDESEIADLETELTEPPAERVSPLILGVAVAGMLVGLFVWGSLAISLMSSTDGILDDFSTNTEGAAVAIEAGKPAQTPVLEPTASPTPDARTNREDCAAIRGTDYRSPEERTWFLENCIEP